MTFRFFIGPERHPLVQIDQSNYGYWLLSLAILLLIGFLRRWYIRMKIRHTPTVAPEPLKRELIESALTEATKTLLAAMKVTGYHNHATTNCESEGRFYRLVFQQVEASSQASLFPEGPPAIQKHDCVLIGRDSAGHVVYMKSYSALTKTKQTADLAQALMLAGLTFQLEPISMLKIPEPD